MGEHGPTRRSMLGMSLAGGAALLFTAACGTRDAKARTAPDPETVALQAAIASEQRLIGLYARAIQGRPELAARLRPILGHHQAHLAELNRRLPARATPGATGKPGTAPPTPTLPASPAPVATLYAAERAAAAVLLDHLARISPGLAQVLASIAASEASHAALLSGGM